MYGHLLDDPDPDSSSDTSTSTVESSIDLSPARLYARTTNFCRTKQVDTLGRAVLCLHVLCPLLFTCVRFYLHVLCPLLRPPRPLLLLGSLTATVSFLLFSRLSSSQSLRALLAGLADGCSSDDATALVHARFKQDETLFPQVRPRFPPPAVLAAPPLLLHNPGCLFLSFPFLPSRASPASSPPFITLFFFLLFSFYTCGHVCSPSSPSSHRFPSFGWAWSFLTHTHRT